MVVKSFILFCFVGVQLATVHSGGGAAETLREVAEKLNQISSIFHDVSISLPANAVAPEVIDGLKKLFGHVIDAD